MGPHVFRCTCEDMYIPLRVWECVTMLHFEGECIYDQQAGKGLKEEVRMSLTRQWLCLAGRDGSWVVGSGQGTPHSAGSCARRAGEGV